MAFAEILPAISAGASILGAGAQAGGTLKGGQAQNANASFQAAVASNNAKIAEQNAEYAIAAGQEKAATNSLKGAAQLGKIKAAQGASGVDVNTGSNVAVQESQREVNKLDTETIMSNAELTAYGYRSQESNYLAQSQLDTQEGAQDVTGSEIGAAGSVLSNASSLGFKWSGVSTPTQTPAQQLAAGTIPV